MFPDMANDSFPVQAYDDYRQLLKARYQELKGRDAKFSHRYLCRAAGYGSSSAFGDVLNGRRKLSPSAAMRLAKALKFGREEEEFFLNLVHLNQAGTLEERNLYYGRMMAMKGIRMETLAPGKYEYFRKWYHAALRELLYFHPCKDDFKALGRRLDPPVPAAQVKKALLLMEELGIVSRDAKGYFRQTAKVITVDGAGGSPDLDNFRVETMRLAIEALDRHPRETRDVSTLTATLSAESVEKAKAAVKSLRQYVLGLAEQDEAVDRVYQLNVQFFPMTRIEAKR